MSHVGGVEIGAFSLRLCWFVDGISRVMLASGWHVGGVYMDLTRKGVCSRGWPLRENSNTTGPSSWEGLESSSTPITDRDLCWHLWA